MVALQRKLSFDDNPPLSLPMRYFLSAPLFAALAAALLLWHGEAALLSRWSPLTLALTHLMVLGCLSMTMLGALLQLLPVLAGVKVAAGGAGAVIHLGLCAGTVLLAAAFCWPHRWLFTLAAALLSLSLLSFIGACATGLWRTRPARGGAVVLHIGLSLTALAVTVLLGAVLAGVFAWPGLQTGLRTGLPAGLPTFSLTGLTDLHALWGLGGWVGLLVMGVAFQVVPMFMVTDPYPDWLTRRGGGALFLLLVCATLSAGQSGFGLAPQHACLLLLAAGYATFAAITLTLLARRKRPRADPTTLYWRTAMVCLLLAGAGPLLPATSAPLTLGVLLIVGCALSAINGMLYKIVPFLLWYQLQGRKGVPNVGKIIPERHARMQYAAHVVALALLLGACQFPAPLARPAAVSMLLACLGLWCNLYAALRLYLRLRALPPGGGGSGVGTRA